MFAALSRTLATWKRGRNGRKPEQEICLVKANNPKEAEEKFVKYFDKTSEYDIYYHVEATVLETIE